MGKGKGRKGDGGKRKAEDMMLTPKHRITVLLPIVFCNFFGKLEWTFLELTPWPGGLIL